MYASTASLIQLVATSSDILPEGAMYREVLAENDAVNSSFGTIPLRYNTSDKQTFLCCWKNLLLFLSSRFFF